MPSMLITESASLWNSGTAQPPGVGVSVGGAVTTGVAVGIGVGVAAGGFFARTIGAGPLAPPPVGTFVSGARRGGTRLCCAATVGRGVGVHTGVARAATTVAVGVAFGVCLRTFFFAWRVTVG